MLWRFEISLLYPPPAYMILSFCDVWLVYGYVPAPFCGHGLVSEFGLRVLTYFFCDFLWDVDSFSCVTGHLKWVIYD